MATAKVQFSSNISEEQKPPRQLSTHRAILGKLFEQADGVAQSYP